MAVVGRIVLGVFIARWDARRVTALSVASQAAALFAMTQTTDVALLFIACAVFGLTVGNLITLPAIVIQREFDAASFGLLVGLSTAIGQFTCVVGPGLLGCAARPHRRLRRVAGALHRARDRRGGRSFGLAT